jgi:integrase
VCVALSPERRKPLRKRLTDEFIRRAKPPTAGQLLIWDDLVTGFGARLTPNAISFIVQWRDSAGRKPRESLRPRFPQLSTAAARDLARKRLLEVLGNTEANEARELRSVVREWFERKSETTAWRPRYRVKVDALIRHYIEGEETPRVSLSPAVRKAIEDLGSTPVGSVTRSAVMRVADGIKRGAAEQFMAIGSSFYNDMFDRGVEVVNPFRNRLRVTGGRRVRSRVLTDAEFLTLWRALEEEGDPALTCFGVLAFTGCRRREATQIQWAEIDLDGATWTLPPARRKTGSRDLQPFLIHLHPFLVEALRAQPVLAGSPFVFWGRRDQRPFEFHHALMKRLRELGVEDWRLHDVRRFVRSGMARLGVSQMVAELCLGHMAKPGLVAVYDAHSYESEKREAWQKWGEHLMRLTAGGGGA